MARDNDATDRRLLALLQMNARESVAMLSRKLGIARTTVQERITRMERNGTIAGYSVLLRRDPFNQYAEAVILLSASKQADGGKTLRTAAQAYKVDTDAIALKVKHEFAAKEKARSAPKVEPKPVPKALKKSA